MREILKERGYKVTPARLAILDIFTKSKKPLSAEMVYKKLDREKNINEVTVYRTLATLEKSGVLNRADLRKDSLYFELADEHHHHLVCTNCDRVEDFENLEIEKEIEKIKRRVVETSSQFKNINDHSLEIFGLCQACA